MALSYIYKIYIGFMIDEQKEHGDVLNTTVVSLQPVAIISRCPTRFGLKIQKIPMRMTLKEPYNCPSTFP